MCPAAGLTIVVAKRYCHDPKRFNMRKYMRDFIPAQIKINQILTIIIRILAIVPKSFANSP